MAEIAQQIFGIFGDPLAKYFIVPILSTLIGAGFKYSCMNDEISEIKRDLFYWGPNLIVTTFLIICVEYYSKIFILTEAVDKQTLSNNCINSIWLSLSIAYIINMLIRKKGWNKKKKKWHLWYGIIIPDVVGMVLLLFVMLILNPDLGSK